MMLQWTVEEERRSSQSSKPNDTLTHCSTRSCSSGTNKKKKERKRIGKAIEAESLSGGGRLATAAPETGKKKKKKEKNGPLARVAPTAHEERVMRRRPLWLSTRTVCSGSSTFVRECNTHTREEEKKKKLLLHKDSTIVLALARRVSKFSFTFCNGENK